MSEITKQKRKRYTIETAEEIRQLKKKHPGLKQEDLAISYDLTQASVSRILSGKTLSGVKKLQTRETKLPQTALDHETISYLKQEIPKINTRLEDLTKILDSISILTTELQKEISTIKTESSQLKKRIDGNDNEIAGLRISINELEEINERNRSKRF